MVSFRLDYIAAWAEKNKRNVMLIKGEIKKSIEFCSER
jgi:hypothetical protein